MMVSTVGGSVAAIVFALCLGSASYGLAALVLPRASTSTRLSAAVLIGWWMLVVLFYPLAWAAMFNRPVAIGAIGLLAAVVVAGTRWGSLHLRALAIADLRRVGVVLRDCLAGVPGLPLIVTGVFVTTHLLRGLVSPPLAWDALTYHLVHAARWVQHGTFAPQAAPDAWGYYEFFPYAGEILWSWMMLPVGGDSLLAPAGVLIVLALGLASYAAARTLDLPRERAALLALAVISTPAVMSFTNSSYVDNTALASFALGCLFLARTLRDPRVPDATLCAIGLGLSAAVKPSGLPLFVTGIGALVVALLTKRSAKLVTTTKLAAIGAVGALPWLLQGIRTWHQVGSPLYPMPLRIFGRTLLAGNPQLEQLLSGAFLLPDVPRRAPFFLVDLFLPSGMESPHLNFGPSGAVFVTLGVAGICRLLFCAQTRLFAAFLTVSIVATVGIMLSPQTIALRLLWSEVTGRLMMPALFALALAGATRLRGSSGDRLWRILILISLWYSKPAGISSTEVAAMMVLLAIGAAIAAALLYGSCLVPLPWRPQRWALTLGLAAVVLVTSAAGIVRRIVRQPIYAAAGSGNSFVLHRLNSRYAGSWPIWEYLDKMEPQRLAVSSGWDGIGHNAYRYPLLGVRLQHEVLYVTPTCSGAVLDYQERARLLEAADFYCWLRHLLEAEVNVVVALAPKNTPESVWLEEHPDVFELLAAGHAEQSLAFRFDPAAARRLLAEAAVSPGIPSRQEATAVSCLPGPSVATASVQ